MVLTGTVICVRTGRWHWTSLWTSLRVIVYIVTVFRGPCAVSGCPACGIIGVTEPLKGGNLWEEFKSSAIHPWRGCWDPGQCFPCLLAAKGKQFFTLRIPYLMLLITGLKAVRTTIHGPNPPKLWSKINLLDIIHLFLSGVPYSTRKPLWTEVFHIN